MEKIKFLSDVFYSKKVKALKYQKGGNPQFNAELNNQNNQNTEKKPQLFIRKKTKKKAIEFNAV